MRRALCLRLRCCASDGTNVQARRVVGVAVGGWLVEQVPGRGVVIANARTLIGLTLREWLDSLLADEAIRRSALHPWELQQWDTAWCEAWITTFLRQPEDF
jgi:hypothetical protein